MKTLFAIIAVMIVRSNAQGSSGAAAAIAQATEILGSLQNQISQNVSGSFGLIQERLGKIPADFDGINERIMAIEKGLSGEALKQFQKVAAQLTTQIQSFDNDLLSPLIDRSSRIANLLNPLIETLNFPFTNEECFLNEITKITGNATEVVKKTELEITEDTNGVLKQINDLVSNLQDQQIAILDEAVKCGVRSLCIAQQVNIREPLLFN